MKMMTAPRSNVRTAPALQPLLLPPLQVAVRLPVVEQRRLQPLLLPSCPLRPGCVRGCLLQSCCCPCLLLSGQTVSTGIRGRSMGTQQAAEGLLQLGYQQKPLPQVNHAL